MVQEIPHHRFPIADRRPPLRKTRLLPIVLVFLFGCSSASEDVVEIDFWGLGVEGEAVKALVPDFERDHPGIRVNVQQIPWRAAHEKLLTAFVGDATPDICQLGNTWIPEFVALHGLAPLDTLVRASGIVARDDYFDGIWKTNQVDGVTYGVPWYVDTRLLFYRSDILLQAGYEEMPETWEEWKDAMIEIKENVGEDDYVILLPTNEWQHPVLFALQMGATLLKENGRFANFSGPRFREALRFYVSLFDEGLAPVLSNTMISNVWQEFERGRISMYLTGPWNIGEFRKRLPEDVQDDWMTAPMPGPDSAGVSLAGGASLVIFETSEHKEAAWTFIEYLSRTETQIRFYEATGSLPPRYSAWRESGLAEDRYASAFYEQLQRVEPLPRVPEWERIADEIWIYAERVIRDQMTIDQAMAALDRQVDDILEKRRWMQAKNDR